MEETLGSGFDDIRAVIMSSTSYSPNMAFQPISVHAVTDISSLSVTHLPVANAAVHTRQSAFSYSNLQTHARHLQSAHMDIGQSISLDHGASTESMDAVTSLGADSMELSMGSELSFMPKTSESHLNMKPRPYSQATYDEEDDKKEDLMTSSSVEYESDADDTRKFYTKIESRVSFGNGIFDSDDEDEDDEDEDSNIDFPQSEQVLTPSNRPGDRFQFSWHVEQSDLVDEYFDPPLQTTQERNYTLDQFIRRWLHVSLLSSAQLPSQLSRPSLEAANVSEWPRPERITRPQNIANDEFFDIQQIPWKSKMGVRREEARKLRDTWYRPYTNLDFSELDHAYTLPNSENYFRANALYTKLKATIEHFQLRNLMAVISSNTVQFAHESRLLTWIPDYRHVRCIVDLTRPPVESGFHGAVKISTMQAKLGITVAGGFGGEYCMHVNGNRSVNTYGFVTHDTNGITNNIDIIRNRSDGSPTVVFASNDQHIRILNCDRNQFVADHKLPIPVNCSETSADGRMRVVVGDSKETLVLEAETGHVLKQLSGHQDFGFACAWSPDMLQIATSNQDRTVNIWDVRTWRLLCSMNSDCACYRSLRFSPVGGGPRTLLMSEPADRIAVVNATTYDSRQVHDFFGEIGGADYTPDGESVWVANSDELFGGFMRFDRVRYGQRYSSSGSSSKSHGNDYWDEEGEEEREEEEEEEYGRSRYAPTWYTKSPHEWLSEAELETDLRSVVSQRERDLRFFNGLSDEARDNLLV